MTVRELINRLEQYPDDTPVVVDDMFVSGSLVAPALTELRNHDGTGPWLQLSASSQIQVEG